ncbi:GntR family transcriptional regulator [Haloferula helveola]|uniref:GntR family transcriptional regulator n=1 Tax=Haloferula helveola TaxID=490095 RepID=A0ABN6GYB8_9BACT|nr:GntR family transcriptional regulator [Haloferula helveola]
MKEKITPVRTIRDQIVGMLRADILSGRLPRGTKLREQALAERFGVSRAPIRDVIMQLTQQGLAVSEPNCGATVSERAAEWMQPLIVKIRLDIEIFALRKSIKQIGDNDIARLEELVEGIGKACADGDMAAVADLDISFHEALLSCADEPDLIAIWLPIVTRMILQYTRLVEREEIHEEHVEILEAVRAKDIQRAVRALKQNIR